MQRKLLNMDSQTLSLNIDKLKNIPTKEDLEKQLKADVYMIHFTKLDGDERIMTCTTRTDLIPKIKRPKTENKTHDTTVTVWDVNANDWRSFRYDRVISVSIMKTI